MRNGRYFAIGVPTSVDTKTVSMMKTSVLVLLALTVHILYSFWHKAILFEVSTLSVKFHCVKSYQQEFETKEHFNLVPSAYFRKSPIIRQKKFDITFIQALAGLFNWKEECISYSLCL